MQKIGLLGGTFDPVHDGHLQLATLARNELSLDKVLLIPAAEPPHKKSKDISPFTHRCEMLRKALKDLKGLEASFIEGDLEKPSFTIDTVRVLQEKTCGSCEYYFIIGVDAFSDLLSWKAYVELLQQVSMVVAYRKGFTENIKLHTIAQTLGYNETLHLWQSTGSLRPIYFLDASPIEISSSHIRSLLREGHGQNVQGIHPEVLQYARQNNLYHTRLKLN